MKTFALAMTTAAVSAWSTSYKFGVADLEQFTIGLLKGAIEAEVPDVMTCIQDAETLVSEVQVVYNDFKQETISSVSDGIKEIGTMVGQVASDFSTCSSGVHGIENLIHMAENFANPWSFAYHIGKDLLVNGVQIFHEVDDAIAQYESGNWNSFGEDIGKALSQVFVGTEENGGCTVPTDVTWVGAACHMRELCGTDCEEGMCQWQYAAG